MTCPTSQPPWVPAGMTESQALAVIERVVKVAARNYSFGIHSSDDVEQVGRMECVILLSKGKYDPARPLKNYLHKHLKRRFINLRREILRADTQSVGCRACYHMWQSSVKTPEPCGADTRQCKQFLTWAANHAQKLKVGFPDNIESASSQTQSMILEDTVFRQVAGRELLDRIDRNLPAELRGDFRILWEGKGIPKDRKSAVQQAVLEILHGDEVLDVLEDEDVID